MEPAERARRNGRRVDLDHRLVPPARRAHGDRRAREAEDERLERDLRQRRRPEIERAVRRLDGEIVIADHRRQRPELHLPLTSGARWMSAPARSASESTANGRPPGAGAMLDRSIDHFQLAHEDAGEAVASPPRRGVARRPGAHAREAELSLGIARHIEPNPTQHQPGDVDRRAARKARGIDRDGELRDVTPLPPAWRDRGA